MKSESQTTQDSPSALNAWILAARPKTLTAGLCPVLVGGTMVALEESIQWQVFLLTCLFSLTIQIGTNFANDYFDFVNGADTDKRCGPKRATQSGWITPQAMRLGMFLAFGIAILFSIPLLAIAGIWAVSLLSLCVLFGIIYTGGPKLGYRGLGDLLVFIFYGPVAVCGTYFLQTLDLHMDVLIASFSPGLLSCAILVANNLRDEESDRAANKNTLVVRYGRNFGAKEYAFCIFAAAILPLFIKIYAPLLLIPLSMPFIKRAFQKTDLRPLLPQTSLLLLVYTLLFWTSYLV